LGSTNQLHMCAILFPPPQSPPGLQWTPLDSRWTMFPAKSDIGPAKIGGLAVHWTPLDSTGLQSSWQSTGVHWTPLDSTGLYWTPLDSTGLKITWSRRPPITNLVLKPRRMTALFPPLNLCSSSSRGQAWGSLTPNRVTRGSSAAQVSATSRTVATAG